MDGEGLDVVFALYGDQSGVGSLSDDGNTLALLVFLGQVGEVLDNGWNVMSVKVV